MVFEILLFQMEDREHTCLIYWYAYLNKVNQKSIKPSLHFQHKQICKDYKDAKTMDKLEFEYHVICSWWLSSSLWLQITGHNRKGVPLLKAIIKRHCD